MIVDFFPFFAPYGEQTLELRVNLLKDYVDYFVIAESNKTHSGQNVERKFSEIAKKLNLPEDKIIYIEHDIPEDEDLVILPMDVADMKNDSRDEIKSKRAKVRERLQKDALLIALDKFDDDTVFIHSDADEIIKPEVIQYVANVCKQNQDIIIKVPLIYLEGRADLRVCYSNGYPVDWSGGMFIATKSQLKKVNPSNIRSNIGNPFPVHYITENGQPVKDLGWHLSWMGGVENRVLKAKVFAHYNDSFEWMRKEDNSSIKFSDDSFIDFLNKTPLTEGSVPPSGNNDHVLKKYPISDLPKMIFEREHLKNFFLPNVDHKDLDVFEKSIMNPSSLISPYKKRVWIVDDFYRNPDEVRQYALTREFDKGGFGRGYMGNRTFKQFLFPGLKEEFEKIMGMKITKWEQHGMNGRFQTCYAGDALVYHCDDQKYAGMLFLTPDAPFETGTSMYAHKATRIRHNSHPEIMSTFSGHTTLDKTPYEPVDVVGNVYNRLVIFDAGMIHAASGYFGYNNENARLWQMFFFDAE
jgi:hypothetical protein